MRNKYLYSVLPFLKECKRETQQQFEEWKKDKYLYEKTLPLIRYIL